MLNPRHPAALNFVLKEPAKLKPRATRNRLPFDLFKKILQGKGLAIYQPARRLNGLRKEQLVLWLLIVIQRHTHPPYLGAPHSGQSFQVGFSSAPQLAQTGACSCCPHSGHSFQLGFTSAPQPGHALAAGWARAGR